jgi:hydrogenase expression/formation protein HypC
MCLAVPGRIMDITETSPLSRVGRVAFGGITKDVNLTFVPQASIGDYVIVHVGVALNTIDESEAKRVFAYLDELGELEELELGSE